MNIRVRSVSKTYRPKSRGARYDASGKQTIHALRDCSLEIKAGGFTVIAGRSGCGKTTLLKIIAGLEQCDSGAVEFVQGVSGAGFGEASTRPKTGFMFQDARLLPWLTVEQNLALAFPHPKTKTEKAALNSEIRRVLELTGLGTRAASLPEELSGGMAQRAALARCLCRNPELLLLDEPLSSLDAFTRNRLREELENLWQRLGLTVILVTHDIEEAVFFGGNVFLMNEGAVAREIPVPLLRPRNCRSAEFQEYCRVIEDAVCAAETGSM